MKLPTNRELGIKPTRKDHRKAEAILQSLTARSSHQSALRVGSTFQMAGPLGKQTFKVIACRENNTFDVVEIQK
jgi:hypothetical protein